MTAAQPAVEGLDLTQNDEDDLFDAVLTGSVDKEKSLLSQQTKTEEIKTEDNEKPEESSETPSTKIQGVYIGKFPWWITQKDVTDLLHKVGVRDITEIIFAENKVNGLSKGYVKVIVHSENSLKLLLERIPNHTLGGENITCNYANNSNLSLFEDMSNRGVSGFPPRTTSLNRNESDSSFLSQNPLESTMPQQFWNRFNTFPPIPNPFLRYPAPPLPHIPPPHLLPFGVNFMNSASHPHPQIHQLNSAIAGTSQDGQSSSLCHNDEKTAKDFEDLINRNRAVASAAINKAVTGATTGDLTVAMETLLTAISIVKKSSVYQDDRCQALVTSLKDCLISIQGSCGSSRHSEEKECKRRKSSSNERRRSTRDRSWSSERSGGRPKECSRNWDRDRTRDGYRDRDGNRDEYRDQDGYRDRHWERDGFRDRDRAQDGHGDRDRDREGHGHRDRDRDGHRERDWNRDGYRARDQAKDGFRDRDRAQDGFRDRDRAQDGFRDRNRDRYY